MKTIEKIQVPQDYYTEMVEALTRAYSQARTNPAKQKARINAIRQSGKDYEVMNNGHKVSVEKIQRYYNEALAIDVDKHEKELADFKEKYEPKLNMYGDLKSAYKDAVKFRTENEYYNDSENNYSLLHDVSHKYYLSEIQMTDLMERLMSLDLLS
tara:strand:- start:445 stop:909 length:465 start_codon:yes stop_codon:yes gene_type:complete